MDKIFNKDKRLIDAIIEDWKNDNTGIRHQVGQVELLTDKTTPVMLQDYDYIVNRGAEGYTLKPKLVWKFIYLDELFEYEKTNERLESFLLNKFNDNGKQVAKVEKITAIISDTKHTLGWEVEII